MIATVLVVAMTLGASPAAGRGESAEPTLPAGPGAAVLREKCLLCHSADYATQQRLTAAQWQRTLEKMRKFGASLTVDEGNVLAEYLAGAWPVGTPDQRPAASPPPGGP